MPLPYELHLALRYLGSRRRSRVVSLVNFFSFFGVFLGVASLVIVLALMTGFQQELRDKILGANSHLLVFDHLMKPVENSPELLAELSRQPEIIAAAPFIYRKVMIVHHRRSDGIVLKGIDPLLSPKVVDVTQHLEEGSLADLDPPPADELREGEEPLPGILLGEELARSLSAAMGSKIKLVSPFEILTPTGYVPKTKHFRVAGIFKSGMYEYDSSWAYVSLAAAQEFFDMGQEVMGFEARVRDIWTVSNTARGLREDLGAEYITRTWIDMNGELFSALQLEKTVAFLFIGMIVLVASFGMTSSLTLLVMEKRREIGILKAMGSTRRSLMLVFLSMGLLIGAAGTITGALVGGVTCWVLDTYQLIQLSGEVYVITHVPFKMKPWDFVFTCAAAMLISLQATLYPAVSASRLDPVEVLREE